MKISELDPISRLHSAMLIPVSIAGKTVNRSLGQVEAYLPPPLVRFLGIRGATANVTYASGASPLATEAIYDSVTDRFYALAETSPEGASVYYEDWEGYADFYTEEGAIRDDRLYLCEDGLYEWKDGELSAVGPGISVLRHLSLLTPVRCEDEDDLKAKVASGDYAVRQQFYIPEED